MEPYSGPAKRRVREQVFAWDGRFAVRQNDAHNHERYKLAPLDGESIITTFLNFFGSRLDPPQYNHAKLQKFLEQSDRDFLLDPNAIGAEHTILLDDRRDDTGWQDINQERHFARDWTSYAAGYPPEGESVLFSMLNAKKLHEKQSKSVYIFIHFLMNLEAYNLQKLDDGAERRIL